MVASLLAIQDDQSAWCWGESDRNQVGPDVLVYRNALRVAIGEPITEMALGRFFTCALVSEKTRCWGHGTNGLFREGGTNSPSATIRIDDRLIDIANLSAGPGHLILTGQPRNQPERYGLFARGARNAELALGRGPEDLTRDTERLADPVGDWRPTDDRGATDTSNTCYRRALDNRTACFGDNADGVRNPSSPVGLEADASAVPELIEGVGSTQSLAVRSGTACAIDEDGLKCWGRSTGFATGRIRVISFDPPAPEQ